MRSGIEACLAYPRIHVECERTIPCPLKDYQESQASPRKTAKRPIACAFVPFFFLQASPCRSSGSGVCQKSRAFCIRKASRSHGEKSCYGVALGPEPAGSCRPNRHKKPAAGPGSTNSLRTMNAHTSFVLEQPLRVDLGSYYCCYYYYIILVLCTVPFPKVLAKRARIRAVGDMPRKD